MCICPAHCLAGRNVLSVCNFCPAQPRCKVNIAQPGKQDLTPPSPKGVQAPNHPFCTQPCSKLLSAHR
eukprot:scaffold86084_cov17-Tisochrysis_lutea.AAC.2